MLSSRCELKVVYNIDTDDNGKRLYHVQKYLIPSRGKTGEDLQIFIKVVNGPGFEINVDGKPFTGTPERVVIAGCTNMKEYDTGRNIMDNVGNIMGTVETGFGMAADGIVVGNFFNDNANWGNEDNLDNEDNGDNGDNEDNGNNEDNGDNEDEFLVI